MITPMDIHNKEFEKGFRGYSSEEVDAFLAQVVQDYEVLYRENREMTDKIEQMEQRLEQYEQMEATMKNTLVLAQETGENVKNAARKEADLIVQEAEHKRREILADADRALRDAHDKYAALSHDMAVFRTKVESILTSQLQMLAGCELNTDKVEAIVASTAEDTALVKADADKADSVAETSLEVEASEEASTKE